MWRHAHMCTSPHVAHPSSSWHILFVRGPETALHHSQPHPILLPGSPAHQRSLHWLHLWQRASVESVKYHNCLLFNIFHDNGRLVHKDSEQCIKHLLLISCQERTWQPTAPAQGLVDVACDATLPPIWFPWINLQPSWVHSKQQYLHFSAERVVGKGKSCQISVFSSGETNFKTGEGRRYQKRTWKWP